MKKNTLFLCRAAIIAALYVVFTLISSLLGLSSGVIQCRLSEALCVLPAIFTEAIPGLAVGCLISNIITASSVWDILFGTIATLIGAVGTYLLKRIKIKGVPVLSPLPPIISNTLIIPFVLRFAIGAEEGLPFLFLTVGTGELISAGVLGMLFLLAFMPYRKHL